MHANEISEVTGGTWHGPMLPEEILHFSHDTRLISKGGIFLALKGNGTDGHDFLAHAKEKGAAGAIVETYNPAIDMPQLKVNDVLSAFQAIALSHRRKFGGKLVGVTGSCGKTSTREILRSFFGLPKTPVNRINWNNLLGVPLNLMELQQSGQPYGVIEAGMDQTGEMDILAKMIEPDCAVITNVYPQHMNNLGTIEAIAREKVKLAQATRKQGLVFTTKSAWEQPVFQELEERIRVISREDEVVENITAKKIVRYSFVKNDRNLIVKITSEDTGAMTFSLKPMIRGMVTNMVIAIVVGRHLGVSEKTIQAALDAWEPLYLRGETLTIDDKYYYVDCYNNLPIALEESLEMFTEFAPQEQERLYVIGGIAGVGSISENAHYEIGKKVPLRKHDRVVLIGKEMVHALRALEERGYKAPEIKYFENAESAKEEVDTFKGSIFLKGSRVYKLESLLPKRKNG